MDTVLFAIFAAIGFFVLRMIFIAHRLRWAARNPGLVDRADLEQAKRSLSMHKDLLREARKEPARLLWEAARGLRSHRTLLREARREPSRHLRAARDSLARARQAAATSMAVPELPRPTRPKVPH